MEFIQPVSWAEALAAKAEHPAAVPIAGRHRRHGRAQLRRPPPGRAAGPDPGRPELADWAADRRPDHGSGRASPTPGSSPSWAARLPGLAMAARTVGLTADPQPRHGRRQPGRRVAGRRLPPAAAGGRGADRGGLGPGHPDDPGRRLLHRRQAQRAGPGRADRGHLDPARGRSRAVRQDRHQERDGDRGVRVQHRAVPAGQADRHWHRARRPRPRAGPPRPSSSWPARWPRPGCGNRGPSCPTRW